VPPTPGRQLDKAAEVDGMTSVVLVIRSPVRGVALMRSKVISQQLARIIETFMTHSFGGRNPPHCALLVTEGT
jgi:hypothetical protein